MKSDSYINSKALSKFLKKYKSTKKGNQEIIKAVQKRSKYCSSLNKQTRTIELKESITTKNKQ